MKNYYIPKYGEFRCIAGACPDSCCAGWEIVLMMPVWNGIEPYPASWENGFVRRWQRMQTAM